MTTRRLATILATDVVAFSSMMERDEEGTLARIKALEREIIEPKVNTHHGRIVKKTGDGFLVEFASPVEAVRCATAIQDELKSGPLQVRIGINLGDILIEEDGDVYGDGVNVAARLEGIASPGGVALSGSVYDQVRKVLPLPYEDLGPTSLKNIEEAVRVFAIRAASGEETPSAGARSKPLPLPDKPSIAVLPFTNMSGDPEQEYFADGITEDIITGLSRLRWLFVIARNSMFVYKGRAIDVRQISRELGVQYLLEGSVRASGQRIRVTGQLVAAETGKQIWAEKYDRQLKDVFSVQDEITENVVATIEPYLYAEESLRFNNQPPESVATWGLVVRALTLINKVDRKANEEALALLRLAVEKEPSYARAYAILAWAMWWQAYNQFRLDRTAIGPIYTEVEELAGRALALDANEPWARITLGLTLSGAGHHDRALENISAALDIQPNWALGRAMLGLALVRAGQFDRAIAETSHALRMSPMDTFAGLYTSFHGLALVAARRFPEALPYLRSSISSFPDFIGHYNTLVSCCGHLGLLEEASIYLQQREKLVGSPIRVRTVRQNLGQFAHCDVYAEGLLKAGVPE